MGNWIAKEWSENDENNRLARDSKVVVADFDPRSPSNNIVRTPIFYVSNSNERNSKQQNVFFNVNDPRSPSEHYVRTPINIKESLANNNDSFDITTADVSTVSDSSFLLQQVPGDDADTKQQQQQQQKDDTTTSSSPDRYALSSKQIFSSNLPRHIIQRKQIEKINKKKHRNFENKKENYE